MLDNNKKKIQLTEDIGKEKEKCMQGPCNKLATRMVLGLKHCVKQILVVQLGIENFEYSRCISCKYGMLKWF